MAYIASIVMAVHTPVDDSDESPKGPQDYPASLGAPHTKASDAYAMRYADVGRLAVRSSLDDFFDSSNKLARYMQLQLR
jgi:hypothetical protein